MAGIKSDRALYLTADHTRVVEHGDPEAAFLLVGEAGTISPYAVSRYDLAKKKGKDGA